MTPKYEKIQHPKRKGVNPLLEKSRGEPTVILGEHIKTLPNTKENLFKALELQKLKGLKTRMTKTEIHIYDILPAREGEQVLDFLKKARKKK